MRGVTNIEFIVAVFVFLTTIAFIAFSIVSNIPLLHGRAESESIRSLAFQFSEQLIFDKGLNEGGGDDWKYDDFSRIGLSTGKRYQISRAKVEELEKICTSPLGYKRVADLAGKNIDVSISVRYNGTDIRVCSSGVASTVRNEFSILRAIVEDNRGEGVLIVKVIR